MKTRLVLFFILFSLTTIGQTSTFNIDTSSTAGRIIKRLKAGNDGTKSLAEQISKRKFQGYRICDKNVFAIDSLDQLLNNDQIVSLYTSQDGTLKFISFILFVRRNNRKDLVVKHLLEILSEKPNSMITDGACNHAVIVSDLGSFCYELITNNNSFFKSDFRLTKKEKKMLQNKLRQYKIG